MRVPTQRVATPARIQVTTSTVVCCSETMVAMWHLYKASVDVACWMSNQEGEAEVLLSRERIKEAGLQDAGLKRSEKYADIRSSSQFQPLQLYQKEPYYMIERSLTVYKPSWYIQV